MKKETLFIRSNGLDVVLWSYTLCGVACQKRGELGRFLWKHQPPGWFGFARCVCGLCSWVSAGGCRKKVERAKKSDRWEHLPRIEKWGHSPLMLECGAFSGKTLGREVL
ncbi:MAG: hypothetical protein CL920_39180 [Deltaproteobacteria bacterium]|nr:hypothetical protein [Deltaproteobacteria bacterium]MBU54759.1 hypothetical protein [Deltaproteobacteria bacterium]